MRIGVPCEVLSDECRVAIAPDTIGRLSKLGFTVQVQSGAGEKASFPDRLYVAAGAVIVDTAKEAWDADIVAKINPPMEHPELGGHEADLLPEGRMLISYIWPAESGDLLERLTRRQATVFAMDCVPRVSRAQKLDSLSSMGNIAGYRAVVEAAHHFGSFFTGQFTAAGKVPPAKVLVIGAGVAGLAAIGAARGLGAIVRAFDTRAAVKDQVESLGGEFLEVEFEESGEGAGGYAKVMSKEFIDAEMALFREQAKDINIVITTALIPGRPAPKLWMEDMVQAMKPGSVVVDLAARNGGNCELTVPGDTVVRHGVTIVGTRDLTSQLATTASNLYGTNIFHLLDDLGGAEGFNIDFDDEVIRGTTVVKDGAVTWPPPPVEPSPAPAANVVEPKVDTPEPVTESVATKEASQASSQGGFGRAEGIVIGLLIAWLGLRYGLDDHVSPATASFLQHLTVFVLACFVGWQVIWNVTAALHTPLMSVTNAISGIILVGAMLQLKGDLTDGATLLGILAVFLATINIAGGFLVTERMLKMFRK